MSILGRILRTSVFRLSLLYALLFSLIAAAALLSVYKFAGNQIEDQIDRRLKLETNLLLENYRKRTLTGLTEDINIYNKKEGRPFYIYALIHQRKLDLKQFIPVEQLPEIIDEKNQNQIFASIPMSEIIDFVNDRNTDETVRVLLTLLPGGYQLLVGAELEETQDLLNQLFKASLIAISIIFALSILIGSLMARRMLNRINAVTKTADNIIDGDLSHRIPVIDDRNNELDRLSRSLNRMLDRNEELMIGTREVSNNLAHDLRNPLNRIRHRIESAKLDKNRLSGDEFKFDDFADDTIEDIDGVISTFNALLSIAQIESGEPRKNWTEFSLNDLLNDLSEIYEIVADEKEIIWQYSSDNDLNINGNKQLIAQLFTNLLDNTFKYSPSKSIISLSAIAKDNSNIEVIISDQGTGIPESEHENVFKRFHRLDSARSTEGNGLGLSLVKAVVDLHDAKISLSDNKPGLIASVSFKR
ncbi:MAG: signal transduction histidine kinase [Cocleimonas sp.]|jgi:signal transduction histidine kinase